MLAIIYSCAYKRKCEKKEDIIGCQPVIILSCMGIGFGKGVHQVYGAGGLVPHAISCFRTENDVEWFMHSSLLYWSAYYTGIFDAGLLIVLYVFY